MAYTITDIVEMVEYHLFISVRDNDAAHANLVQLVHHLDLLTPRPLYREATPDFLRLLRVFSRYRPHPS